MKNKGFWTFNTSHASSKLAQNYDITKVFSTAFFILQGKQVIRPIAFRPVPGVGGNSGASTPTNGNVFGLFRPMGGGGGTAPSSGQTTPASMLQPYSDVQPSPAPPPFTSHVTLGGGVVPGGTGGHPPHLLQLPKPNEGFAPGHPLVKDGRRHYGSKSTNVDWRFFVVSIQGIISILSRLLPYRIIDK